VYAAVCLLVLVVVAIITARCLTRQTEALMPAAPSGRVKVDQANYRLYRSLSTQVPGTPLAAGNTAATLPQVGASFRVRVGVENKEEVMKKILEAANKLAGESFAIDTPVTALSGGQSRALMIADTAILSTSPIVLIDEIENAGIDRRKALELLVSQDKIVLMATHDPLLALMADRRIVIKNGGIHKVLTTTDEERDLLNELSKIDNVMQAARGKLRLGEVLGLEDAKIG